ncbi:MAG TPA: hypothetical protein VFZ77_19475 [Acidimicrobiales bacterium]
MRRLLRLAMPAVFAVSTVVYVAPASADHDADRHENMDLLVNLPNTTGATNSDIAFWGDRAYVGNYDGFRIFDISDPANPALLSDFRCYGPQNDPVVWDNKLLFLAVDRTLTGPDCGSGDTAHDDPEGWEGVRIFDVSNPRSPRFLDAVYTDCGAHTITLYPKNPAQIMLYVSSYPLRPGPTCGQLRGPEAGRDPAHGVIQVIRVPVNNPEAAKEVAEPEIVYPGDSDNVFVWSEHGLPGPPVLEPEARACHDMTVFVELNLVAAACAEQGQLWRIRPNGIPDTEHPIWVFDDEEDETGITGDPADTGVVVDFFHSATFSWDGSVVNFIDESFGVGCPPVTVGPVSGDTGRMFFVDAASGELLSHFMLPRTESALDADGNETAYCSAHLGNPTVSAGRDLLINAWYMGGVDVIDFTDPRNPEEIAYYDIAPAGPTGSDNWSAYWYEGARLGSGTFPVYATDGVHNPATGRGFQVFAALVGEADFELDRLNPQTQERVFDG